MRQFEKEKTAIEKYNKNIKPGQKTKSLKGKEFMSSQRQHEYAMKFKGYESAFYQNHNL